MTESEPTTATTVPPEATEAVVTFYPQQWIRDLAGPDGDPVSFTVPIEDATDEDGELLEDDSYESDQLKEHENAPTEVTDHHGPFYVAIGEVR